MLLTIGNAQILNAANHQDQAICQSKSNPLYVIVFTTTINELQKYVYFLHRFTFKVKVKIDDAASKTLECYGEPKTTKKAAEEHAAEGLLWCLKQEGYLRDR